MMGNNQSGMGEGREFASRGTLHRHGFGGWGEAEGEQGGDSGGGFGRNGYPGYERFGGRFHGMHGRGCPMERLRALHAFKHRFGNWVAANFAEHRNAPHGRQGNMGQGWGGFPHWKGGHFGGRFGGVGGWDDMNMTGHDFGGVAANVEEEPDAFLISLSLPGVDKKAVVVSVREDALIVGYTPSEMEGGEERNYIRREFGPQAFERSFQLGGKVLTDQISATYTDGILVIRLPKNPEADEPLHEVEIG